MHGRWTESSSTGALQTSAQAPSRCWDRKLVRETNRKRLQPADQQRNLTMRHGVGTPAHPALGCWVAELRRASVSRSSTRGARDSAYGCCAGCRVLVADRRNYYGWVRAQGGRRPGPDPARVHRANAGVEAGRRHHLLSDRRGVALPRHGRGSVQQRSGRIRPRAALRARRDIENWSTLYNERRLHSSYLRPREPCRAPGGFHRITPLVGASSPGFRPHTECLESSSMRASGLGPAAAAGVRRAFDVDALERALLTTISGTVAGA